MSDIYIIGVSQFNTRKLNKVSPPLSQFDLISRVLDNALKDAGTQIKRSHLNGLISMHPGLTSLDDSMPCGTYGYYTQWLATKLDLHNPYNKPFLTKDYHFGGATPVSQCLTAKYLIENNRNIDCVATLILQTPNSLDRNKLIGGRNNYFDNQLKELKINKKKVIAIPALYNAHTERFLAKYGTKYGITRKHFAMVPVLMHRNGYYNSESLSYKDEKLKNATVDTILNSRNIGCSCITQYECARLSDGCFSLIIANKRFIVKNKINLNRCCKILGGAENDQSFRHKPYIDSVDPIRNYSMYHAIKQCYINSNCAVNDIHWFGIYDCYPISFILGMLCIGICTIENLASFLEEWYEKRLKYNINTHGGLLSFGAPTCVPSGYTIIEAVRQMRNESSKEAQINFNVKSDQKLKALIFGNGGIFQQSSAMVIEKAVMSSKL